MDYIGEKCAACGEVFTENDDIVVCPDCGSPHHRECYKNAGKCANEDYHFSGKKWERKQAKVRDIVICPVCRFPNDKNEEICTRCGSALNTGDIGNDETVQDVIAGLLDDEAAETGPYLGFDPDEDLGGATVREVSDFVKTNTIYYLPVFKRMKDIGSKLSFNLICLFFPSLYFANRKMWGWAMLAVILSLLFAVPKALIYLADSGTLLEEASLYHFVEDNSATLEKLSIICSAADSFVRLLFCIFGNSIYFKYIVRSLKKIRNSSEPLMKQKMTVMGGVNPTNMIVITIIKAVVAAGILLLASYAYGVFTLMDDLGQNTAFINIISNL